MNTDPRYINDSIFTIKFKTIITVICIFPDVIILVLAEFISNPIVSLAFCTQRRLLSHADHPPKWHKDHIVCVSQVVEKVALYRAQ